MHENKRILARIFRISTPTPNRDFTKPNPKSLAKERQNQERRRIEQENDKLYKRLVSIPTSSYLDHSKLKTDFERTKKIRDLRSRTRSTALRTHQKPGHSSSRLTETPLPDLKLPNKQKTSPTSLNVSVYESQSNPSEAVILPKSGSMPMITVYNSSRPIASQATDSISFLTQS